MHLSNIGCLVNWYFITPMKLRQQNKKVIKEAGNAAAHGDDIEFNSKMAEPLFKFTSEYFV